MCRLPIGAYLITPKLSFVDNYNRFVSYNFFGSGRQDGLGFVGLAWAGGWEAVCCCSETTAGCGKGGLEQLGPLSLPSHSFTVSPCGLVWVSSQHGSLKVSDFLPGG